MTWIAPREEDLVDLCLQLIGVRSPSAQEGPIADLVARTMGSLGYDVRTDELGNVLGVLGGAPGLCVVLDAHLDTVGTTDAADWSHSPGGELADGRIYGRGAADMKGPLCAALLGVAGLSADLRSGSVVVAATVAEELVEGAALTYVLKHLSADHVIICESTGLGLSLGQRGRAEVLVEVRGKATHSSRPELGRNAAEDMVDIVRRVRGLDPPVHPLLGPGVLVLTDLISEPYPGLSVVPHLCRATYDRRTLPGETEQDVLAPIQEILDDARRTAGTDAGLAIAEDVFCTYTGVEVRAPNFAPAWLQPADSAVVRQASAGLRRAGLTADHTHYSFATNGSASAGRLGIPTVGYGPGHEEQAHVADEYIEVAELVTAARGYAAIVGALLESDDA
jgi:putative selenium metabolism hydrolase